jgi:Terminase small subunit
MARTAPNTARSALDPRLKTRKRRPPAVRRVQQPNIPKSPLCGDIDDFTPGPLKVPTVEDWRFINSYLRHNNATRAYHDAGYHGRGDGSNDGSNAYKMLRKPIIQHTLAYLARQALLKAARSTNITKEKVLGDLEEERVAAMEDRQYSSAVKASELHGRSIGMFQDGFSDMDTAPRIIINDYTVNDNRQITVAGTRQTDPLLAVTAGIEDQEGSALTSPQPPRSTPSLQPPCRPLGTSEAPITETITGTTDYPEPVLSARAAARNAIRVVEISDADLHQS